MTDKAKRRVRVVQCAYCGNLFRVRRKPANDALHLLQCPHCCFVWDYDDTRSELVSAEDAEHLPLVK